MKKNYNCNNAVIADSLFVLWTIITIISWLSNKSLTADSVFFDRLIVTGVYFLARTIIPVLGRCSDIVFGVLLFSFYMYELVLGYLQLFGLIVTNDQYNIIVGTFDNSGPYGGFIAIISVFLLIFFLQYKEKHKIVSYLCFAAYILGVILLPSVRSRAAMLASLVSLLVFFYTSYREKLKKYMVYILAAILLCGTAAYFYKKPSANGRAFMSKISTEALFSTRFFGNGLGSFSGVYGHQQYLYFSKKIDNIQDYSKVNESERMVADCPAESFNDYLGIGIESGLFSMILYVAIIGIVLYSAKKRNVIWIYGLIVYSIFALFSYPSKLLVFQILFPLLLSLCVTEKEVTGMSFSKYRFVTLILFLLPLSGLTCLYPSIRDYKENVAIWKTKARKLYLLNKYDKFIEVGDQLYESLNSYYPFIFAYGRSLHYQGNYEKSDSVLMLGTEINSDPMYWNVMGNNSLAQGRFREAEERYKHAFVMVPNRLYPLYLLCKLYHIEGDSAKFMQMAEVVETFIPKVESVNTEKMREEIMEIKAGYNMDAVTDEK